MNDVSFYRLRMTWTTEGRQNSLPPDLLRDFISTTNLIGLGEGALGSVEFKNNLHKGDIVAVFAQHTTPLVLTRVIDEKEQDYENKGLFPKIDDWLFKVRKVEILSWYPDDKERLSLPIFSKNWPEHSFSVAGGFLQPITDWYNRIMKDPKMEDLKQTLLKAHNLILTGAPGTGKTFLAKQIARDITGDTEGNDPHIGFCQFHPSYDYTDFVEGLRPTQPKDDENIGFERQDGIFMDFCKKALAKKKTNHFEDAFEKLRQELENNYTKENPLSLTTPAQSKPFKIFLNTNGGLSVITSSGTVQCSLTQDRISGFLTGTNSNDYWKSYCQGVINYLEANHGLTTSEENSEQKYVFIIDEINRGDIAKIFGELFYAIDPGYRGPKGAIQTQYAKLSQDKNIFKDGKFYVPENVYIIGTMNDIDRNVESMDFAIRRRFTWIEINPNDTKDMLDKEIPEYATDAKKCMNAINMQISKTDGLGPAYQLGAAYFLKLKDYDGDSKERFNQLWKYNIRPLLNEYLRGLPQAKNKLKDLEKSFWTALGGQPETGTNNNNPADEQQ